ncbi:MULTISPECIES: DUF2079 domain-containing protein [Streptomyces]|uniref:DUF2079 domain-containing protein n=1 Tax=Streptomyces TaxID=1883 RepID=UPI0013186006|nr:MULTISPECIES: DUF2079 domain-containing protein [Streptomyces]QGZ50713.1 DUF2079 domain-containing protein [Streptomyces sp. QHH-9511]GGT83185.1 hypothetical protein GCM10010272_29790 [Streptomyces lateritius]
MRTIADRSIQVVPAVLRLPRRASALLPWAWAAALCLLYATVAVRRHVLLRTTGYDLGIFEQAVRAYAELRAPVVPLRGPGFNLLGDHFHPLLAALAPLYRIWPSPLCLLIAQSALLALAVVPLARWALRVLGRRAAHVVAAGYGLSWGIASAAAFDFHEVALAVPLLAHSLEALGRRRWGHAVAWAAPLLLIKEDLGLTLAAVGVYIAVKGPRRLGVATAAAGLIGSLIEIKLLLPAFNPGGDYAHGGNLSDGYGSLLSTLAHAPLDALRPDIKAMTLVLVFAPSALLALRSPLSLIAVPTLAWRMVSENGFHWGTAFHYSAILMPVVFAGLIDALAVWRRAGHPLAARHVRASLATVLAVTAVMIPSFPLAQLAQRATWRTTPHIEAARELLAKIPDGATVAASNRLIPQLTSRCTVVVFPTFPVDNELYRYDRTVFPPPTTEWILHDAQAPEAWPYKTGHWPYPIEQQEAELKAARERHGYELVAHRDGLTLLHRPTRPRPGATR